VIDGEQIPLTDFTKRKDVEGMMWREALDAEYAYREYAASRRVITWLAVVAAQDCEFVADERTLRATALALRGRALQLQQRRRAAWQRRRNKADAMVEKRA
jgi:hypothetical protein